MAAISVDVKEQIKQSIDIVDLIGSHLSLQRRGRKFVANCPWHDDRRPSLQIDPERQSFKCFVCDIGGDVFSFVMRTENVEFPEALAILAERAGISLEGSRGGAPKPQLREDRDVVAWARQRFHEYLVRDLAAEPARRYLTERGITLASIERFRLGFSPESWDWLLRAARSESISPAALQRVGLVIQRDERGGHYDRFRGRVLFPINDQLGRPVGFGGRVLPGIAEEKGDAAGAKYINSPESPLFVKSKLLYGLDLARGEFQAKREAIVVEGYTDCLIAHQCGIPNTVAVLGTALGAGHIKLLRRLVDRVVLLLDGDVAGQRRANEVLDLFVAEQFDLRVATLPEGQDPCDYLLQHGGEAFRGVVRRAVDALEHKMQVTLAAIEGQETAHASNQAVEAVLSTLAQVKRGDGVVSSAARLREEQMLHMLAQRFGVSEAALRSRLATLRRSSATQYRLPDDEEAAVDEDIPPGRLDPWDRDLLEILVHQPECVVTALQHIAPSQLRSELGREIYQKVCDLAEADELPTLDRLMLEFESPRLRQLLNNLDEGGRAKEQGDWSGLLRAYIERLAGAGEDSQQVAAIRAMRERRMDENEEFAALRDMISRQRDIQRKKRGMQSDKKPAK